MGPGTNLVSMGVPFFTLSNILDSSRRQKRHDSFVVKSRLAKGLFESICAPATHERLVAGMCLYVVDSLAGLVTA